VAIQARILSTAIAEPPYRFTQDVLLDKLCTVVFGPTWSTDPDLRERASRYVRLFSASGVQQRYSSVDLLTYYDQPRSTGARMQDYRRLAYPLARTAMAACLEQAGVVQAEALSDLFVVSCTGYDSPGLDLLLARDLGMPADIRRVVIGHMGCYGALVGLRQSLAALRAHEQSLVALLTVELCSLHYPDIQEPEVLPVYALFGDGVAATLLSADPGAQGPELVDTYCAAVFGAMGQMAWHVTDTGFIMELSPRVPITLRNHICPTLERLLAPHGLASRDITHWLIHPGGPSILEVIQDRVGLSDEQMALSCQILREHGNCSSSTVLIMLDTLLRSGTARPGEWGVMMAFGPGLTLETCLLRF
jgi:predicted naringenin-chalcone synthase